MAQRSYKTRQKISQTMKGTSNFQGQTHSIGSKAKISDRRGHYDPIRQKKWFVHDDSGKTVRRTQHPGGLYQKGRIADEKEIKMKSFIDFVIEDNKAMVKKMSDEHPEARFRTNPLKPTMSMKDRQAQRKNLSNLLKKKMSEENTMKKLDSRPGNVALRNAIANINRKAQDKINQRTAKAKADSKPR